MVARKPLMAFLVITRGLVSWPRWMKMFGRNQKRRQSYSTFQLVKVVYLRAIGKL